MNPVVPTLLCTTPAVMSSVTPYQRSGLIDIGLNVLPFDRPIARYALRIPRPFCSVSWSPPSPPAAAAASASGLVSESGSDWACARTANSMPSTTPTIVVCLASITVRWNIAHVDPGHLFGGHFLAVRDLTRTSHRPLM